MTHPKEIKQKGQRVGARPTDVRRDDGEGAEVGLPHVLRQRVGVVLEASQQCRRAALRVLDQLPVGARVRGQDGAAHAHQVLIGRDRKGEGLG